MNYNETNEDIEQFQSSFKNGSGYNGYWGLSIGVIMILILIIIGFALFIYLGKIKKVIPPGQIPSGGSLLRKMRR